MENYPRLGTAFAVRTLFDGDKNVAQSGGEGPAGSKVVDQFPVELSVYRVSLNLVTRSTR